MKRSGQCPKCGSMEIIADAQALDRGDGNAKYELSVATFRKPDAVIFKQRQTSTVSAWVCQECGYVELYADSPASLNYLNDDSPNTAAPPDFFERPRSKHEREIANTGDRGVRLTSRRKLD